MRVTRLLLETTRGIQKTRVLDRIHSRFNARGQTRKTHMPWCLHRDVGLCCCKLQPGIIYGAHATYYPKMGMLRVGEHLFGIGGSNDDQIGRHVMLSIINAAGSPSLSIFLNAPLQIMVLSLMYFTPSHGVIGQPVGRQILSRFMRLVRFLHRDGMSFVTHMRRIQRCVKRFLVRRWEKRALAVMMSSHARLGSRAGGMEELPTDIAMTIVLATLG